MFERLRRAAPAGLWATVALSLAPAAQAQSTADYRARVAANASALQRMQAYRAQADTSRMRLLPTDTIRGGPFVVLTDPADTQLVRRTTAAATRDLETSFGPAITRVNLRVAALTREHNQVQDSVVRVSDVDPGGRRRGSMTVIASDSTVRDLWKHRAAHALMGEMGPGFSNWLRIGLPIDSVTDEAWRGVRADLVTAPGTLAHECFSGDTGRCALALGVTGADDPATKWLNAEEREDLVRAHAYMVRRGREALYRQCVNESTASACDSLAHLIPPDRVQPRLPYEARQSLVRVARSIGGAGAFDRMLAAPQNIEDQLRAASGVSTDSLMRVWRAQVVAAPAETTTMTMGTALSALFWVGVCGGLALGSSRWR